MNNLLLLLISILGIPLLFLLFKKLTMGGRVAAIVVALAISLGTGYTGIILISSFFVLGVAATAFGRRQKEKLGYAEPRGGQRNAGQVLANGGMAAILGVAAWCYPAHRAILELLTACAASSATADTLSSEIGTVAGKRMYNILGFRKDRRGENGVISVEGTLAGIAGSLLIAVIYVLLTSWSMALLLVIVLAGTIGNLTDSILGATLERRKVLGNNAVNFLNTLAGSLAGFALYSVFI